MDTPDNKTPVVYLVYDAGDDPEACILTTPEEQARLRLDTGSFQKWRDEQVYRAQVYTAYKRVDQKVKPVPAVFPEDARVIRRFPEDRKSVV